MANEATIIELMNGGRPIRFTCADGTGIPKGTLLGLSDDRTVSVSTAADTPLVGIAASEKVADDGSTTIAAYTDGIFELLSDVGTDSAGAMMTSNSADNVIATAEAADLLNGSTIGFLLQDAASNERVAVRVNK